MQKEFINAYYNYNIIEYTNSYLKSLIQYIYYLYIYILRICKTI